MMHMADTGIKGTDLYIWDEDTRSWQFVNCNRPVRIDNDIRPRQDSIQSKVYVDRLDGKMHEYMLYLPLYDGVRWIEIGVDSTAVIKQPVLNSPQVGKKFVFYGTSILQGGCACRPGMVATSIIQRDLDVECVNLGFSGEGKMDSCMARAMATIPDVAPTACKEISSAELKYHALSYASMIEPFTFHSDAKQALTTIGARPFAPGRHATRAE